MAKKSNAKRSKSGTKTPTREPTSEVASRSTSPEPSVGDDGDKAEDTTEAVSTGEDAQVDELPVSKAADTLSPSFQAEEIRAAPEEGVEQTSEPGSDEREILRDVGVAAKETVNQQLSTVEDAVPADSEQGQDEASATPQAETNEFVKAEEVSNELEDDPATNPLEPSTSQPETTAIRDGNPISEASPSAANGDTVDEAEQPDEPDAEGEDEVEDEDEDEGDRIQNLEAELAQTVREKEHLSTQYRSLLGKLQAMRNSLGEKLKEDAEELDRREVAINQLTNDLQTTQTTLSTVQTELASLSQENSSLDAQLVQLRLETKHKDEQESSDVVSLTRELRELRGDMERIRMEREEWEEEAGREREKRERLEEERRGMERRLMDAEERRTGAEDGWRREEKRASNLEEVLGEFQAAKDLEIAQATNELESQLRYAASSLAEYKSRTADAENRLSTLQSDAGRSAKLDKELKEKTAMIGKLRHDSVVMQEHLTEALRRLRRNTSETNVDRRLVTNILLQFITAPRADPKRFEMLSLLATILSWEDGEREKAGLQRSGGGGGPSKLRRKASEMNVSASETKATSKGKDKENDAGAYSESFSNLFVEFLLKEAAQGQRTKDSNPSSAQGSPHSPPASIHPASPGTERGGGTTPGMFGFSRGRTYSTASATSTAMGDARSPPYVGSIGRKYSQNAGQVLGLNGLGGSGPVSPHIGDGLLSPDAPGPRR